MSNEAEYNQYFMYFRIPRFKQRFSFLTPKCERGNELEILDCLKVSDTTLLLLSANCKSDDVIDKWGTRILNMALAQGLPTPIVTIMDLESINPKKRTSVRSDIQKLIQKSLPDERAMNFDTNSDALNLLRRIGGQKKNTIHNKANRPHMHVENYNFHADVGCDSGTLQVSGYLRGQSLDVNQLVHIPGLGDYQMSQIDLKHLDQSTNTFTSSTVFAKADPDKQTQLIRENIPDEMDAEQTWPTEDEIAQSKMENKKLTKKIPKGMSDYQAAWIPDDDDEYSQDGSEDDDDEDDESGEDYMSCTSNENSDDEDMHDAEDEKFDTVSVSEAAPNDEKYDRGNLLFSINFKFLF